MGINLETGWIYFETAKGAKWRLRLNDVIAVHIHSKNSYGDEYLEIWLRSIPRSLLFSKGKPEAPSEDNLGAEDGDFLTHETCKELEKIFDKYFCAAKS